jgi:hypothetical protein
MPTQELKDFVEDRLRAYDPTMDLTEGSPAQVQIVDPIVRRFTPDPFEMDVDKFIEARLSQEYPDMDVREGSAVRDLLVKPNTVLLDPIQREVTLIKQNQSLAAPELLAPSEADALAANLFVRRSTGGLSVGRVRMYFNAPIAITISLGNVFYTSNGLNFIPTSLQSISADAMLFNQEGNLYYFDVALTAEKPGTDYNIDKGEVVGVSNISTAVRVANLAKFSGGLDEEDTEALVARTEESLTERSLVVLRGVSARLRDQFPDLLHLQVIGFGDAEMNRDLLVGGDLGTSLLGGSDGYTDDDGDGDEETYTFRTRYTSLSPTFGGIGTVENYWLVATEVQYGADGQIQISHLDRFISNSARFKTSDVGLALVRFGASASVNNGVAKILEVINATTIRINVTGSIETGIQWFLARPSEDYEVVEVYDDQSLIVSSEKALPVTSATFVWDIRQKELTISDIPGGIETPTVEGTLEIQSNAVHIGGHTDFFVRGTGIDSAQMTLNSITDEEPLIDKQTLDTDTAVLGTEFVQDLTTDFFVAGVKPGYSLIIETGPNAGTRTVLKVTSAEPNKLQVYPVITSTVSGQKYRVIDDIDINLRDPKNLKGHGTDLRTLQLSNIVTTSSAVDFSALGVVEGDILRILLGPDKGEYVVTQVTGTGNKKLVLNTQLTATESGLGWEVFTQQVGMDFPLIRLTTIDLLDSGNQPTGDTIPYADPVDIRTTSFSNTGRGEKVATYDAITGIVGTRNLDTVSYPLTTCLLYISINGGSSTIITLTGSADKAEVLSRINSAISSIADTLDVSGESRLVLRSRNRWIKVLPGSSNSAIGFNNASGEDNRQIKSESAITDWTDGDYDLREVRDSVWIQTGDNIGYLYLLSVASNKLLAFSVRDGNIQFLQPNTGVAVSVGSRSYGNARLYFLAPTSCSVRGAWRPPLVSTGTNPGNMAWTVAGTEAIAEDEPGISYFTATVNGTELRFVPDPDLMHELLPVGSEDVPNNLETTSGDFWVQCNAAPSTVPGEVSRQAVIDFLRREILPGDLLKVTYKPIQGENDITDTNLYTTGQPECLFGKTVILAAEGSVPRVCTFSDQLTGPQDVIDELNEAFGFEVAHLEEVTSPGTATYLRLEADVDFTLLGNGTANGTSSTMLGLGSVTKNNQAEAHIDGYYHILQVAQGTTHHKLQVETDGGTAPAATAHSQHFEIFRPGLQRLYSGGMKDQTELGLYYMDVELISEGVGDQWNLTSGLQMSVAGHESDGYTLYTPDENLTFSEEEEITLTLSRRILLPSVSDIPSNATNLYSYNIQVNYDRSPITSQIQAFASAELERVLTANILVRHLMPHFLNFAINYRGGSTSDIVEADILDYLEGLSPTDRVEVSALQDLVKRRGASYIQNPITLIAVAHLLDRSINVDRSQDYVSKGRLATFFPDTITISRETSSVL